MVIKPIKLKNEIKNMTIDEVYVQFERFIYKSCQTWRRKYELDDLIQVAFIGLSKAYESYEVKNDVLFLTYAAMVINNELRMYHRKNKKHENTISMSTTFQLNNNDNLELGDMLQDDINYEDVAINNIQCEELKSAMQKLSSREQKLIQDIHFNYKSQREIGLELNLTQSYVSREHKKALLKLKSIMEGKKMPEAKITREQLVEEVKVLGTGKKAAVEIGKKYGLAPSTIRTYFDSMDVRKEKSVNKVEILKTEKVLVPVLFRGNIGEYEILENEVNIKFDNNSIILMKKNISGLIRELQELNETLI